MSEVFFPSDPDPAHEPWEQDLLSLAGGLSRSPADVVPFAMDGRRLYFVNSAAAAQHVLVEQRQRYVSVPLPLGTISPALTEPGAALLRQKIRESPATASPPLGELVTTAVDACLDRLGHAARAGTPVDLLPLFQQTLLGLMTRTLFGVTVPPERIAAVAAANQTMERYRAYQLPAGTIPCHTAVSQRHQTASEIARAYAHEILARTGLDDLLPAASAPAPRFDEEHAGTSAADPLAIVSRVLMNSYNGPAVALTWLAWIVSREPVVQRSLAAEAAAAFPSGSTAFDAMPALPRARQVVQETLRLYPPAWLLARQTIEPDRIGSVGIEQNATVVISPFTLHRDRRSWSEPERFLPDRFDPRTATPPPPGAYLPFGLGPSQCPASAFAQRELQYALARIAHRFELCAAPPDHIRPWGLISLPPSPRAAVVLRERNRAG